MKKTTRFAVWLLLMPCVFSQEPAGSKKPETPASEEKQDEGIPVTSELVQKSCAPCHKIDEKKRMSRISYRRTTPEGWQETLKRMVKLNNLQIDPKDAREVVRYLSNHQGLAPEELRPGAFEVERRMIDYKYTDQDTERTCIQCHSFGRVLLQRRTKEDWELLVAMHRGFYPLSDFQAFRRMGPPQTQPGPDGRPPDNRHPMDKAVQHLSSAFPLKTPEWSAWAANMRDPKIEGRWALSAYERGKGPIYGTTQIRAVRSDEFETETRLVYAQSGRSSVRKGRAIIYTGFQWRGRSNEGSDETDSLREVMFVERDWRNIWGRWFNGAYDEFGPDVKLWKIGNDPVVLGTDVTSLRTSTSGKTLRIYGANLPALKASDFDLGPGVKVARLISSNPDLAAVEVEVAADASIGERDLFVAGVKGQSGIVIYDKIDGIRVLPQAGMARIGGINFPKQYQQYEAVAYSNGPDGKPETKDDLSLGLVDVTWSMEEFTATFGDDDKDFVGTIDATGLFTPNVDGPNPKRRNNTNNYGDVWVVATFTPPAGSKESKPIRARAHLLVTVPLYMRFEQPEVAK